MKKKVIIASVLVLLVGSSAFAVSIPKEEVTPKVEESVKMVEKKEEPIVIEEKPIEQEPVQIQTTASPQQVVSNEPVVPQTAVPTVSELVVKHGWNDLADPQMYINMFELRNPGYFSDDNLDYSMGWVIRASNAHNNGIAGSNSANVVYFSKFLMNEKISKIEEITGVKY